MKADIVMKHMVLAPKTVILISIYVYSFGLTTFVWKVFIYIKDTSTIPNDPTKYDLQSAHVKCFDDYMNLGYI